MKKNGTKLLAGMLAAAAMFGFLEENTMTVQADQSYVDTAEYPSLSEVYDPYFKVGVAVQAIDHFNDPTAEIGNADKEALIARCFDRITFGNELKPAYNFDPTSPTLFTINPAAAELLNWAKQQQLPVRGHVLVWHSQVDPAIFARDFKALSDGKETHNEKDELDEDCLVSRKELIERLRTYIYGAIEYTYQNGFADVIDTWDVVNEAVDEVEPDGLRRSYWYRIIGPEYLYYSFLFAREATEKYSVEYAGQYGLDASQDDLSAIKPELFYNDYNEWYENRADITVRFLTEDAFNQNGRLIKSDVIKPDGDGTIFGDGLLDGIGMQGHLDVTQSIPRYMDALRKYDTAVGNVQITELDVGITGKGADAEYRQAKFYYDFFSALVAEAKSGTHLSSVTFWGLTDDASWRRDANPLLFRGDLSRKGAFDMVVAAGLGDPFTLTEEALQKDDSRLLIDFEPTYENGKASLAIPALLGFYSRGSGHQASLSLTATENHTPNADKGYALMVKRSEADATMKLDLSRFAGNTVRAEVWVKTEDSEVVLGMEGTENILLDKKTSAGDWLELSGCVAIPDSWSEAFLYIETNKNAIFYVDDVLVEPVEDSENAFDTESEALSAGEPIEEAAKEASVGRMASGRAKIIGAFLGIGVFCAGAALLLKKVKR